MPLPHGQPNYVCACVRATAVTSHRLNPVVSGEDSTVARSVYTPVGESAPATPLFFIATIEGRGGGGMDGGWVIVTCSIFSTRF